MKEVVTGTIVASQVKSTGETEMREGFITLQIGEDEFVRFDVGIYTKYEALDERIKFALS